MSKLAVLVSLPAVMLLAAGEARAFNEKCDDLRMNLIPVYQTIVERLKQHLWTRDNALKIDLEANSDANMKLSQQADHHDKRMKNAVRAFNDDDPEAEHLCRKIILEANCASYLVYQDTVINLPGMKRDEIIAEGIRRCERARHF